jgi:hypothetical protein
MSTLKDREIVLPHTRSAVVRSRQLKRLQVTMLSWASRSGKRDTCRSDTYEDDKDSDRKELFAV